MTKPCVGKCQHRRQHGLAEQKIVRRKKPCVGLCYLKKKRAAEERKRRKKEAMKKMSV